MHYTLQMRKEKVQTRSECVFVCVPCTRANVRAHAHAPLIGGYETSFMAKRCERKKSWRSIYIHLSDGMLDSHACQALFYFHFNLHFVYMQNRKPHDNDDWLPKNISARFSSFKFCLRILCMHIGLNCDTVSFGGVFAISLALATSVCLSLLFLLIVRPLQFLHWWCHCVASGMMPKRISENVIVFELFFFFHPADPFSQTCNQNVFQYGHYWVIVI